VHQSSTRDFCPYITWTVWHTAEIDWTPGNLVFYLDGQEIYSVTGNWVPDEPMTWVIQNESALYGPEAKPDSWAQINLSSVAVYSYLGRT
jgi:beta-glucanase (GH16 family)